MMAGRARRWMRLATYGLWLVLCGTTGPHAVANGSTGLAMPRALEGLAPAGSQCGRTPAEQQAVDQHRALPLPDYACALGAAEALQSAGRWTWVDTRRSDLAEADPQPDTLRISADALLGKRYLKDKALLLVSDGTVESQTFAQCRRLREAGFSKVRVLAGGWPQHHFVKALGASGESAAALLPPPARLDAGLAWAASQDGSQLVLGLKAEGLSELLPFATTVEAWSVGAVRAAVERRRKQVPHPPLLGLAVLSARASLSPSQLDALRQALRPLSVSVYQGDKDEMQQQLRQVESAWAARERGPKQPRCGQ